MSSSDDEELKLALALSLQPDQGQSNKPSSAEHAIDLTSDTDDDDEDMRRAIALSLEETKSIKQEHVKEASSESESKAISTKQLPLLAKDPTPSKPTANLSILQGLDRKKMEEERLARLGKRKRDDEPEQSEPKRSKDNPENASLQYPTGTIKRTFAKGFPRTDDITIEEVLQAHLVNIAVISSFMWDSEWLNEKLNPLKVKQIWIMNAKGHDVQQRWRDEMAACNIPNLKLHFPPMGGNIQNMHSKFMLLFGKEKLRIVVSTANMIRTDWGEVENDWQAGVMENSVFLIDLPRGDDGAVGDVEELTRFGKELVYFLEKQEVAQNVIEGVLKFDFARTKDLAFVHSIGGGDSSHPTGLPSLSQAIRDLDLNDVKTIELDYAASSLGAINDTFLQRIYLAASGEEYKPTSSVPQVRKHIRIYFPTNEAVENSIGGPDCGGIISLNRSYYNADTFPRESMRNYDSIRRGMLSHNKLLFARGRKQDGTPFAWVYIGSANLSESAWGGQKVLKSGRMGSLNIRNWECGVVVTVPREKIEALGLDDGQMIPMSVFEGTIEVPFVVPGQEYGEKQPWFFRST